MGERAAFGRRRPSAASSSSSGSGLSGLGPQTTATSSENLPTSRTVPQHEERARVRCFGAQRTYCGPSRKIERRSASFYSQLPLIIQAVANDAVPLDSITDTLSDNNDETGKGAPARISSRRLAVFGLFLAVILSLLCGCFFGFLVYQPLLVMGDERGSTSYGSSALFQFDLTRNIFTMFLDLRFTIFLGNKSNLPGQILVEPPDERGFPVAFTFPGCRGWNASRALTYMQVRLTEAEAKGLSIQGNSDMELFFYGSYQRNAVLEFGIESKGEWAAAGVNETLKAEFLAPRAPSDLVRYSHQTYTASFRGGAGSTTEESSSLCDLNQGSMSGLALLQVAYLLRQMCVSGGMVLMELDYGKVHMYTLAGYAGAMKQRTYPLYIPCAVSDMS